MKQKITDKTTVPPQGYCYEYRGHNILIEPGFCCLLGEISFNGTIVDSGFCGYGLATAMARINTRIDLDLSEQ